MILLHRTAEYENTLKVMKFKKFKFDKIFSKNSIWSTNYGDCKVIEAINYKNIKIQFLDTGYIRSVRITDLLRGNVKDYLKPTVCNIGYLGENFRNIKNNNPDMFNKIYQVWHDMIKRCYDKNNSSYIRYGKIGVSVSEEWHNFSQFYNDSFRLMGWDKDKFINKELFLDKDKFQINIPNGQRVYSKSTCCWLSRKENNSLMNCENQKIQFIVTYKDGSEEIVSGIRSFAKKHGIYFTNICACLRGKQKTYKGMKFRNL